MNLKQLMFKLQKALIHKGQNIQINQMQYYSETLGRNCSKYVIKENNETIFSSHKTIAVIEFLAEILKEGG